MAPTVSILTATYNRREYLPSLIAMVRAQTYDLRKCEWVIMDDSPESNADLFQELAASNTVSVQYYHYQGERLAIGAKRNMLNDRARGEYLITFDDDDFHMPERISHSVMMLDKYKADFGGCSGINMYFSDDETVWEYKFQAHGHFTNGTAIYRKSYLTEHRYKDDAKYAEEAGFTNNYEKAIVQLNPLKTILVKCHPGNTVDKRFMRLFSPDMKATRLKLRDFIKDPKMREIFKQLGRFNGEPIRVPPNVAKQIEASLQAERASACTDESPRQDCSAKESGDQQ